MDNSHALGKLRSDISEIVAGVISSVLPDTAVMEKIAEILRERELNNVILVAIGKAAWRMSSTAKSVLGDRISNGILITKYGHSEGNIENIEIYEAGHPLPDENTLLATKRALEMTSKLSSDQTVLFLISGGGSALFELPKDGITIAEMQDITNQLLKSGASIVEVNTVRKHLSAVKGGRFAQHVAPAKVISLVLSDVLEDRLDSIASGPAYPDSSTSQQALEIVKRYNIRLSQKAFEALGEETPKNIDNVESYVIGSVRTACKKAQQLAKAMGYNALLLTTSLDCEAREVGRMFGSIAKEIKNYDKPIEKPCAIIAGGETVVRVKGNGKGGRNQELALSFALSVEGLDSVALCSFGTDGTDGPTDAAGGIVDGQTAQKIRRAGYSPEELLENNDSYTALKIANDLLITGPTGTNVNDVIILLVV